MGVMNDVNFKISFLKFTLINFYLIKFGEVLNFTNFGDSFETTVKRLYKNEKNF